MRNATRWLVAALVGAGLGCGVGYVSGDAADVASSQAELSVKDCLEQHGFDGGFLDHDAGFSIFKACAEQAGFGHHDGGCHFDHDGGLWLGHFDDGGFPSGFGHHDGTWFGHHCDHDGGFHGPDGDADDDGGESFGWPGSGGDGGHHHHDGGP